MAHFRHGPQASLREQSAQSVLPRSETIGLESSSSDAMDESMVPVNRLAFRVWLGGFLFLSLLAVGDLLVALFRHR
jgi:hypothetical protein